MWSDKSSLHQDVSITATDTLQCHCLVFLFLLLTCLRRWTANFSGEVFLESCISMSLESIELSKEISKQQNGGMKIEITRCMTMSSDKVVKQHSLLWLSVYFHLWHVIAGHSICDYLAWNSGFANAFLLQWKD